jgi:hypothetical protein
LARNILFIGWLFLSAQADGLDFSCATFHAYLTEDDIISQYGSENVTNGPVVGADDGPTEGTILFATQDDARVEIAWHDPETKLKPAWVRVRGEQSRWRTPNGIVPGADLLAIERANGWPFRLAGFSSELHGAVRSWGRGRLGPEGNPLCDTRITFQPRRPGDPLLIRQVTDRSDVSSGHPAMQALNPRVAEIWIRHSIRRRSSANPDDAILDVLVFGAHVPIDPEQYPPLLRTEVEQYLRRAAAYRSRSTPPSALDMRMAHAAQVRYETSLAATSNDPRAGAIAESYVNRLKPCYEWEGLADCPEREARFADEYQAANPNGPLNEFLPLLAAHRWLCAAEAYDQQKPSAAANTARRLYEQRLAVARQSKVLMIRSAAERLAARGRCLAVN